MVVVAAACGDGGAGGDGRGPAITPTAGDRVMAYSAMLLAAQPVSIVATPRRWADDGEGRPGGPAGREREGRGGVVDACDRLWKSRPPERRSGAARVRQGRRKAARLGCRVGCTEGRRGRHAAAGGGAGMHWLGGWVGWAGGLSVEAEASRGAGASEHPQRQQATADRRGWWREGSGAKSSVAGCIAASGGGGERRTCCSNVGSTDLHPCCCVCACVCVCVFVCWCVWRR